MNSKTLQELCGEAGLTCGKYEHAYGRSGECFSITTGDPWNVLTDLIEVIMDQPVPDVDEREYVLSDLLKTLRSPKQTEFNMDIVLWWPTIPWEVT